MVEIYIARLKKMNKGKTWDGKKHWVSWIVSLSLCRTRYFYWTEEWYSFILCWHTDIWTNWSGPASHTWQWELDWNPKTQWRTGYEFWIVFCFCSLPYSHLKIFKSLQQLLLVSEVRWPMIQESAFRVPARSTMYPHTWLMVAVNGTTGTADASVKNGITLQVPAQSRNVTSQSYQTLENSWSSQDRLQQLASSKTSLCGLQEERNGPTRWAYHALGRGHSDSPLQEEHQVLGRGVPKACMEIKGFPPGGTKLVQISERPRKSW